MGTELSIGSEVAVKCKQQHQKMAAKAKVKQTSIQSKGPDKQQEDKIKQQLAKAKNLYIHIYIVYPKGKRSTGRAVVVTFELVTSPIQKVKGSG